VKWSSWWPGRRAVRLVRLAKGVQLRQMHGPSRAARLLQAGVHVSRPGCRWRRGGGGAMLQYRPAVLRSLPLHGPYGVQSTPRRPVHEYGSRRRLLLHALARTNVEALSGFRFDVRAMMCRRTMVMIAGVMAVQRERERGSRHGHAMSCWEMRARRTGLIRPVFRVSSLALTRRQLQDIQ